MIRMISIMTDNEGDFIVEEITDNGFVKLGDWGRLEDFKDPVTVDYESLRSHFQPMCPDFIIDAQALSESYKRALIQHIDKTRDGVRLETLKVENGNDTWTVKNNKLEITITTKGGQNGR